MIPEPEWLRWPKNLKFYSISVLMSFNGISHLEVLNYIKWICQFQLDMRKIIFWKFNKLIQIIFLPCLRKKKLKYQKRRSYKCFSLTIYRLFIEFYCNPNKTWYVFRIFWEFKIHDKLSSRLSYPQTLIH